VLQAVFRTDVDPAVRSSTALALARLGDRDMLPVVGETLVQSENGAVSMALVEALEAFDDPAAVPYLEAVVVGQEVPYYVRQRSLEALGRLGRGNVGPYLQGLLSKSDNVAYRFMAAEGLGFIRDTSAVSLLRDAFQKDPAIPVRLAAAGALSLLGVGLEISPVLEHYLMHENDSFRIPALEVMARIGDVGRVPTLKDAMFLLPPIEVHRGIVAALAGTDDDVAVEALEQGYNGLQDTEAREAIVEALGGVDRALARKVLLRILKGAEDPGLRASTLRALARSGDIEQVAVLRPYLKNIDPEVRFQAASGILQLSSAEEN
jgi:HEAT repeat protein